MTKLLLIDPDATSRSALAQVFEDRGDEVVVAETAESGARLAFSERPQAVLVAADQGRDPSFGAAPTRSRSSGVKPQAVRSLQGAAGIERSSPGASTLGSVAVEPSTNGADSTRGTARLPGHCAAAAELCKKLVELASGHPGPVLVYDHSEVDADATRSLLAAGASAVVPASQLAALPEIVDLHMGLVHRLREGASEFAQLRDEYQQLVRKLQGWVDSSLKDGADHHDVILNEVVAARPDGALIVDARGVIQDADPGAELLLGGPVTSRTVAKLVPESRLAAFIEAARPDTRERFVFDVPALSRRPPRRLLASVVCLGAGDDSSRLRIVLLLDLSRRQQIERLADDASIVRVPESYQRRLLQHVHERCSLDAMPRASMAAKRLHMALLNAARHLRPVLLRGRPETARSRYAEMLHHTRRTAGPMVEVACDGLGAASQETELFGERASEGRSRLLGAVALADGGTLLLHEAQCLSPACQERLALVAKDPHLRLIATIDPASAADESALIPAFAAVFAGTAIDIPSLKSMRDDLPGLIGEAIGVDTYLRMPAAIRDALLGWSWPQDRREFDLEVARLRAIRGRKFELSDLSAAIVRAYESGETAIDPALAGFEPVELAPQARPGADAATLALGRRSPAGSSFSHAAMPTAGAAGWVPSVGDWTITEEDPIDLNHYERKAILRALSAAGGNRTRAAEVLGVGKSTFYRKLAKLGLR